MCTHPIVQAALIVAGAALSVVIAIVAARVDRWREFQRRRQLLLAALERYEQAQHFWRPSPSADKREA